MLKIVKKKDFLHKIKEKQTRILLMYKLGIY